MVMCTAIFMKRSAIFVESVGVTVAHSVYERKLLQN